MTDSSFSKGEGSSNLWGDAQESDQYFVPSFLSNEFNTPFSIGEESKTKDDFSSLFPGLTSTLNGSSMTSNSFLDPNKETTSLFQSLSGSNSLQITSEPLLGSIRNGSRSTGPSMSSVAAQECQCGHIFLDMDDYLSHIAVTGHQKAPSSQVGSISLDSVRNLEFQPANGGYPGPGASGGYPFNKRSPQVPLPGGRGGYGGPGVGKRFDNVSGGFGMDMGPPMMPLDEMGYPIDNRFDRFEPPMGPMGHMGPPPPLPGRGGGRGGLRDGYRDPPGMMGYRDPVPGPYDYPGPHEGYPGPPPYMGPGLGPAHHHPMKYGPTHGPGMHNLQADPSVYIVSFGAVVKQDSLVGGCGWWIANEMKTVVVHGSAPVQQSFPSQIRLEYEALLNGLKAAHLKHMKYLLIRSCSDMILSLLRNEKFHMFQSIYSLVSDLDQAVQKLIPQFAHIELEWIHPDSNYYSQKLAKDSIANFYRRKESNFSRA